MSASLSTIKRKLCSTNLAHYQYGKAQKEGFHIKDDQSSQAFKGVPHGKHASMISKAVAKTGYDSNVRQQPIIGFYSNSGGQTVLPQDVWSQELPYCRAVLDPFSKRKAITGGI